MTRGALESKFLREGYDMTHPTDPALLHLTRDVLVHADRGQWSQAAEALHALSLHRGSSPTASRRLLHEAATNPERLVRRALRLPARPRVSSQHAELANARLLFADYDPRSAA